MERWLKVSGWEGRYEVSDAGRIRSIDRTIKARNGKGDYSYLQKGKVLRTSPAKNGYPVVTLSGQSEGACHRYVHRLVAEAFLGPCPEGAEVCHYDGVKTNNVLTNLRYDTRAGNANDRHRHGTMNPPRGEACPSAKLTEDAVRWIRRNEGAVSYRTMGRMFGVAHHTASNAARGIWWEHVK